MTGHAPAQDSCLQHLIKSYHIAVARWTFRKRIGTGLHALENNILAGKQLKIDYDLYCFKAFREYYTDFYYSFSGSFFSQDMT